MRLNEISLKDKRLFDKYLRLKEHSLAAFSFENIYIWKGLFEVSWSQIKGHLCLFFRDKAGIFMFLPPLGKDKDVSVLENVFNFLDSQNKNRDVSRIENLEIEDALFYQGYGYKYRLKSYDYLCETKALSDLSGKPFKAKRACRNYFIKHYVFRYLPFSLKHRKPCLELYLSWMKERKKKYKDKVYQGMLKDSFSALKETFAGYSKMNFKARIVSIAGRIGAFTIGFPLNEEIFCVLYEIADLSKKGLAQFIFSRFCQDLKKYRYINVMDDSGFGNLRKTKLSYRPAKLIPSYIVKRD
jgi:hypothetical protein